MQQWLSRSAVCWLIVGQLALLPCHGTLIPKLPCWFFPSPPAATRSRRTQRASGTAPPLSACWQRRRVPHSSACMLCHRSYCCWVVYNTLKTAPAAAKVGQKCQLRCVPACTSAAAPTWPHLTNLLASSHPSLPALQKKAKQKVSSRPHTLFATGPQQAPGPGLEFEAPPPAAMGPTGFAAGMPMPPPPAMPPMMGVPGERAFSTGFAREMFVMPRFKGSECCCCCRRCCKPL